MVPMPCCGVPNPGGAPRALEQLLDDLALDVEAFGICRIAPDWRLRLPAVDTVTFHFVLDGERILRPGSRIMVAALMRECLVEVFRRLSRNAGCQVSWLRTLEEPGLGRALAAMLDRPGDHHTVATLAAQCYLSRSAFARRCRDRFGDSPIAYLRAIRLRQFSRAFKDHYGISPNAFRA